MLRLYTPHHHFFTTYLLVLYRVCRRVARCLLLLVFSVSYPRVTHLRTQPRRPAHARRTHTQTKRKCRRLLRNALVHRIEFHQGGGLFQFYREKQRLACLVVVAKHAVDKGQQVPRGM